MKMFICSYIGKFICTYIFRYATTEVTGNRKDKEGRTMLPSMKITLTQNKRLKNMLFFASEATQVL